MDEPAEARTAAVMAKSLIVVVKIRIDIDEVASWTM